jgi:hypothetical protein
MSGLEVSVALDTWIKNTTKCAVVDGDHMGVAFCIVFLVVFGLVYINQRELFFYGIHIGWLSG